METKDTLFFIVGKSRKDPEPEYYAGPGNAWTKDIHKAFRFPQYRNAGEMIAAQASGMALDNWEPRFIESIEAGEPTGQEYMGA